MKVYETGGKVYEAIVALILDRCGSKYEWGIKLNGVHVDSDFALYKNKKLKQVILVTHSTSESGTNMKYWRNIEELFELKVAHPGLIVSSVLFPGKWKVGLKNIINTVFDGTLDLDAKPYSIELRDNLNRIIKASAKLSGVKVVQALQSLIDSDDSFENLFSKIEKDFQRNISKAEPIKDLDSLWAQERRRQAKLSKRKQGEFALTDTFYKSGLILLSFFTNAERSEIYSFILKGSPISTSTIKRIASLGAGTEVRTLKGGSVSIVNQIIYCVNHLGKEAADGLIDHMVKKFGVQLTDYLGILTNTENSRIFIKKELLPILSQQRELAVVTLSGLIRKGFHHGKRNTFLETCIQVCKFRDSRFSFDVIVREGAIARGNGPQRFASIDKCLIGEAMPDPDVITKLSGVLFDRLGSADVGSICKGFDDFCQSMAHQTYVTLIKHRSVNYLKELIVQHLKKKGWAVEQNGVKYRSCLSEFAMVAPNVGDPIFTCVLVRNGRRVLCHIISAYTATHKHKECPGKLRVARYSLTRNGSTLNFTSQAPSDAYMILDGPWTQLFGEAERVLEAFHDSGWKGVIDARSVLGGDIPSE